MTAPKTMPPITGETTLGELEGILRAHGVRFMEADFAARSGVDVSLDDGIAYQPTLAEALFHALRDLRIQQAEELDLTDEEARS